MTCYQAEGFFVEISLLLIRYSELPTTINPSSI